MADLVGRTIGNYVVQKEVGRGGMGAVYLAEHPRLKRQVAVKVLHPDMSRDAEMVARFFNEARAASDIKNAHIVDILDFGELPDGTSYLIMEWLEGRSLADVLRRDPRLSLPRTAHIASGVGRALAAAHAHGVVHRDLKPDNIFLVRHDDDPDFVKVLDFGIAKLLVAGDGPSPRTATNVVLGTPAYMSPEQCRGESSTIDGRSDIYSLGVILYEMAAGRRPFNSETYTGILIAHVTQQPPPPRAHQPELSEAAERVILRALDKERDRRYARVEEMVNEFAAAVGVPGIAIPLASRAGSVSAPPSSTAPGVASEAGRPGSSSGRSTLLAYASRETALPQPPATTTPAPLPLPTPSIHGEVLPPASTRPGAPLTPSLSGRSPVPADTLAEVTARKRAPLLAFAGGGLVAMLLVGVMFFARGPSGSTAISASLVPAVSPPGVGSGAPPVPAPPSEAPPPPRIDHPLINPSARLVPPSTVAAPSPPAPEPVGPGAAVTPPKDEEPALPPPARPAKPSPAHGSRPLAATTNSPPPGGLAPAAAAPPAPARVEQPVAPVPPPPPPPPRVTEVPPPPPPPAAVRPVEPPHRAVEEPSDDLDRQLAREAAALVPGGKRYGPKMMGTGEEGQGQDRFVMLEAGRCYTFVTVGSASMGRIYAYLWDPTGKRVATDKPDGLVSNFTICPPFTGQYHFQGKPADGAGTFKTGVYTTR